MEGDGADDDDDADDKKNMCFALFVKMDSKLSERE